MSEKESEIVPITKVTFEEREKILTVSHEWTANGVINEQHRRFNEESIRKMIAYELDDKKKLKDAIDKIEGDIKNVESQMEEKKVEQVVLTEDQLKLREDIKALQMHENYTKGSEKIESLKSQLESLNKNLKEKNALLEEIKVKAASLDLQKLFQ